MPFVTLNVKIDNQFLTHENANSKPKFEKKPNIHITQVQVYASQMTITWHVFKWDFLAKPSSTWWIPTNKLFRFFCFVFVFCHCSFHSVLSCHLVTLEFYCSKPKCHLIFFFARKFINFIVVKAQLSVRYIVLNNVSNSFVKKIGLS